MALKWFFQVTEISIVINWCPGDYRFESSDHQFLKFGKCVSTMVAFWCIETKYILIHVILQILYIKHRFFPLDGKTLNIDSSSLPLKLINLLCQVLNLLNFHITGRQKPPTLAIELVMALELLCLWLSAWTSCKSTIWESEHE